MIALFNFVSITQTGGNRTIAAFAALMFSQSMFTPTRSTMLCCNAVIFFSTTAGKTVQVRGELIDRTKRHTRPNRLREAVEWGYKEQAVKWIREHESIECNAQLLLNEQRFAWHKIRAVRCLQINCISDNIRKFIPWLVR